LRIKKQILPEVAVIPVKQYLTRICAPTVKPGDYVKTGEVIAKGVDPESPPIHSSISGTVREIVERSDPFGSTSECIVVESDGKDTWAKPRFDGGLNEIIFNGGIVETYALYRPSHSRGADTIILNGTDHLPYVFVDQTVLLEEKDEVIKGLRIMMEASGARRGVIGINSSNVNLIEAVRFGVAGEDIQILPLKMIYTRGMGRLLIRDISKQLKTDLGRALVSRVPKARAVYEAVEGGRPFVETCVSVYGAQETGVPRVRIGTSIQDVIQSLGGYLGTPKRIFMNSPMTGIAQYSDEVPVVRSTYAITIQYDTPDEGQGPCIRCAKCVDACPVNLLPSTLALYSRKNKFEECKRYHLFACIECGYCSYTCPSKIPIMQLIRYAKSNLEGAP
jgi:electron transport complex protein RnfC